LKRQLGFLIDLNKCIGCKGCEMACKNEHRLGEEGRRKIISLADEANNIFGFLSMACNHCANPACLGACPNKCFKKRRDGIVLHNPINCSCCKSCIGACPFGAPQVNMDKRKIDKCNFCIERLEKGGSPACVAACIPEALKIIDIADSSATDCLEILPSFKMARITNPSVRFILSRTPESFWRSS
jgi:Fe-S-cluster-containing dehydrogenase component